MKSKILVVVLVATEVAIAAVAIDRYVFVPVSCSHTETYAERLIQRVLTTTPTLRMKTLMRLRREQVDRCISQLPYDVDLRMEAAAFAQFRGDTSGAVDQYRAALKVDRRPELFLDLGNVLYGSGRKQEAIQAFAWLTAFTSFMISYDPDVPWGSERVADLIPNDIQSDVNREAQHLKMSTLRH